MQLCMPHCTLTKRHKAVLFEMVVIHPEWRGQPLRVLALMSVWGHLWNRNRLKHSGTVEEKVGIGEGGEKAAELVMVNSLGLQ